MKRILFFVYTPFEAISALAIRNQFYSDSLADIILSDSIQNREQMRENIYKYELFDNVYFVDLRRFFPKSKNRIKHEYNRIKSAFNPYYLARSIGLRDLSYDVFISTEIVYFTESIFSLLRSKNRELIIELMDEGYSSYTYYFREAYRPTTLKNRLKSWMFKTPGRIYGRKFMSAEAKSVYYYAPELLCWDDIPYTIKQIKVKESRVFQQKMNQLFDYETLEQNGLAEEFDRPYLYFEESFFWSMGNNNDVGIIDHIANIVGRESMAIKLHPRNEINRFEKKGYKTNKTYGLPWELIATNLPDDDMRVFISFSSGSVLNYKFFSNKSFNTILLYKCIGDEYYHVEDSVQEWFTKFKKYYGDSVFIPNTIEELDEFLISHMCKD